MRLDLFLKSSRLCPRRTVAQRLCEAGLVLIGDRRAKSAQDITAGDEITILRSGRVTRVRVKTLPERRQTSRQEASDLFEVLRDEFPEPD